MTVTATLTGPTRNTATTIPQIRVAIDHDARENSDYTVNTNSQGLTIPAGQKGVIHNISISRALRTSWWKA